MDTSRLISVIMHSKMLHNTVVPHHKITFAPLQAHVGGPVAFNCKANDGTIDSATTLYFSATVSNVNDTPTFAYNANANVSGWSGAGTSGTPYTFTVAEDSSNGEVSFTIADEDGQATALIN